MFIQLTYANGQPLVINAKRIYRIQPQPEAGADIITQNDVFPDRETVPEIAAKLEATGAGPDQSRSSNLPAQSGRSLNRAAA